MTTEQLREAKERAYRQSGVARDVALNHGHRAGDLRFVHWFHKEVAKEIKARREAFDNERA